MLLPQDPLNRSFGGDFTQGSSQLRSCPILTHMLTLYEVYSVQAPGIAAAQTRAPAEEAATREAATCALQHTVAFEGQPAQVVVVTVVGAAVAAATDPAALDVDVCAERVTVRLPEQQPYTVRHRTLAQLSSVADQIGRIPVMLLPLRRLRYPLL